MRRSGLCFRVEHFVQLLPAQKLLAQLLLGQVGTDNVLVDLRQFRLQAGHVNDDALNFSPSQLLRCLQAMQARNQSVIPGQRDRIYKANSGDALCQVLNRL